VLAVVGACLPVSSSTQPVEVHAQAAWSWCAGSPGIRSRARHTGQRPPLRRRYPAPHAEHWLITGRPPAAAEPPQRPYPGPVAGHPLRCCARRSGDTEPQRSGLRRAASESLTCRGLVSNSSSGSQQCSSGGHFRFRRAAAKGEPHPSTVSRLRCCCAFGARTRPHHGSASGSVTVWPSVEAAGLRSQRSWLCRRASCRGPLREDLLDPPWCRVETPVLAG
jgi:hypothetical protein